MVKIILFLASLLVLAFGLSQLADQPGHVLVQFGTLEIKVSLVTGLFAVLLAAIAIHFVWTLLRLALRLPSLVGLANRMRRQARGQTALARGLVAVGTGNARLAQRYAQEADRLLGKEPLAMLLSAQSAQLSGNHKSAETAFKAMLDKPETEALGLRGLYIEAERQGDAQTARLFAEEAYRRSPDSAWAGAALLGFKASAGDWRGAVGIIDQNVSRRLVDRETGRAQRAVMLAAAAREALETRPDEALALAQEALRISPGLVPAAELAGRRLAAAGDFAKATRILETAWKLNPHPDLAEAHLAVRIGDSALDRLKRAKTLLKLAPNSRESRFILARAAVDAREFMQAREALETLVLQKPTMRACLLMAELEEKETGNQGLVRAWLARASRATRDPAWVADGVVSDSWLPVSPVTGRIGAFEWMEPPQASEANLRARIDADRFEPAALPDNTAMTTAAMPMPAEAGAEHMPAEAGANPMPAEAPAAAMAPIPADIGPKTMPAEMAPKPPTQAAAKTMENASKSMPMAPPQPIIADDPGTEMVEAKPARRRFFG